MLPQRTRTFVALMTVLVLFVGLISVPGHVHADDEDEPTKIYKLARSLYYENADQGGFTIWVNGDIGQDKTYRITSVNGGDPIPDFKLTKFNGKDTVARKDLKGAYILNFWASWCPPCRAEFPLFVKNLKDKTLTVPVIFVDVQDIKADAQTFLLAYTGPTKLTAVVDPHSSLYMKLGFRVIPDTVLVDAEGNVQAIQFGEMSEVAMKFFVEIATHPGVGAFDSLDPENQPPAASATPAPEGTPDVTPQPQSPRS